MSSSHTATLQPPARAIAPATGQPATPGRRSRFGRAGLALWRAMEAFGQARAHRELRLLADRWEVTDPALSADLRRAIAFDCTSSRDVPARR